MGFEDEELKKRREERAKERKFQQTQRKMLRIGLIVTGITLVLCAASLLITMLAVRKPQQPSLQAPSTTGTTAPKPTQPDTVIHLVAGGDVNVTDKVVASGQTANGYDYTQVLLDAAPLLSGADLTAVNFEGSLFGAPYGTATHSAPQELAQALKNAGVDLVQAANSHTIANGLTGMYATLSGLRETGMTPLGAYESSAEFKKTGGYVIREVQGIRIAFVAFTKGMDGMGLPAGSENCVNLLYKDYSSTYQKVDKTAITQVLRAAAQQKPDVTVALLHWGSEYNNQISKTQESITKLMLEQGVDAIIGTHSHYVQEVHYDAAAGTVVAYSLGDLLGDGAMAGTESSILLDLEITKDGATGKVSITGWDYIPLYLAGTGEEESLRLLRIREALAAYENNAIGKVTQEEYLEMKAALERIEEKMK